MEISISTGIYPPDIGGPSTYLSKLIPYLLKKGHNINVITLSDQKKFINKDIANKNLKIIRVKRSSNKFIRFVLILYSMFYLFGKSKKIYSNGLFFETNIFCIFFRKKFIAKIVGDYHWERFMNYKLWDGTIEDFNKSNNPFIKIIFFVRKFTFYKCFVIITPSFYLKKIVNSWKLNKKIEVINNFVFIEKKNKYNLKFDEYLSKFKNNNCICTISRLVRHKNIIKTIELIDYKKNNLVHFIVGDGPELENINNFIINKGLEKNVFLLGKLEKNDVYKILEHSKLHILLSSYEGFPHIFLESAFFNTIIISLDIGGNSEIISDEINGFLIKNFDAYKINQIITKIFSDVSYSKKILHNSEKIISRFDPDFLIKKKYEFLKEKLI